MNRSILWASITALLAACSVGEKEYDATGTFESTEVTVSAETNGRIMQLSIEESEEIDAAMQVGLIDTVQPALKARQLGATEQSIASRRPDIQIQIASTQAQLMKAEREVARQRALLNDNAGTQKQLDDALNAWQVLQKQLEAQKSSLGSSTRSLNSQMSATAIEREQALDQLTKCHIQSPVSGIVLEKYAEPGEYAIVGKPLFKVADLRQMYLRAYVTSAQLNEVKLGQRVKVTSCAGADEARLYEGVITWISSKSEFTPNNILTDDERANQVYAVKIAVKNDGFLKIGMYGKVKL